MKRRIYEPGTAIGENEYLLKIRSDKTGFMTKLTQKGEYPKAFLDWGVEGWKPKKTDLPVYIMTETYKAGWKIMSWRFGMSQNWATVLHPDGFKVEIYLQDLLKIIQTNVVVKGVIQGEFMWKSNTLIKRKES